MDKMCCIFGAGDYTGTRINADIIRDGYVIAADGGTLYCDEHGITPSLIVGDFDSMEERKGSNVIKYPVMKDDSDTMLALQEGSKRGYDKFMIYGGTGGRLDHTIANIQSLIYLAEHGSQGYLVGGNETITVIKNGKLCFDRSFEGIISVFSAGERAEGVKLRGLLYELDDYTLVNHRPLGLSNEFCGKEASVEVKNGTLIVMWQNHTDAILPVLSLPAD